MVGVTTRERVVDYGASVILGAIVWVMVMWLDGPLWAAYGFAYGVFQLDRARSAFGRHS